MTRGDVYRVHLRDGRGHEQRGARYALIVQADELLRLSTVIVAPTSRSARPATFRPEVEIDGERTLVLVEQLRTIDAQRLGTRVGHISAAELARVDEAIELVLGLR